MERNRHGITKILVMIYQQDSLSAWNNFWRKQTLTTSSFNKINISSYTFLYLHSWFDKTGCTVVVNPSVACIGFRGAGLESLLCSGPNQLFISYYTKVPLSWFLTENQYSSLHHVQRFACHNKWHKGRGLSQQNFIGLQQRNVASNVRGRQRQKDKNSLRAFF